MPREATASSRACYPGVSGLVQFSLARFRHLQLWSPEVASKIVGEVVAALWKSSFGLLVGGQSISGYF